MKDNTKNKKNLVKVIKKSPEYKAAKGYAMSSLASAFMSALAGIAVAGLLGYFGIKDKN